MSRVAFAFRYAGSAVDEGLIDVRDLAPALLAVGDICEQANFQINGDESKASVHIRAVAPSSFIVEFYLLVNFFKAIRKIFDSETIRNAHEVFELAKDVIETAKALKGRKIEEVTDLDSGLKRLTVEHKHTIDISSDLYAMISRPPVQDDLDGIIRPLRSEGIDKLEILQEGTLVETVDGDDIAAFDALPSAFPAPKEEGELSVTPSLIEGSFRVVTISSDPRKHWTLMHAGNPYNVKVDDKGLFQMAKEGHLGIEPGFIVRAEVKSEIRFVRGEQRVENHLVRILSSKAPEPRDDGSNPLPLKP